MTAIIAGFLVMAAVALWGYRRRFLTMSGAVVACLVGVGVWTGGRWGLAAPLLFFFVVSSALTRWSSRRVWTARKSSSGGTARDGWQVAANGAVPAACAIIAFVSSDARWLYGGLCAMAAMTGDTWSSELGRVLASRPLDLRRFRRVDAGISGAVSAAGTLAGLGGAMLTTAIGAALLPEAGRPAWFVIFVIGGWAFLAGWVDSILGASIQMRFRCTVCGKLTDHEQHCSEPAQRTAGISGINNSTVNFLTTIFAALAGFLL